ncbi:nestin-like [Ylistrum balloti]|uniref:nestin-like n=1 Tax=Ylistrum balloti TaxID=509963 RepID=UPI0029059B98|nr:nestin-like [Ylistrum balloti]
MPESGIYDRPKTFRSGTTLQPKYSVQHRSDILLVEQTDTVRNAQSTLQQILTDLENAKTEDEIEQLRAEAQAARDKGDSAILVLQILYKIDSELVHARKDLENALEHENGDIMEARKRVMWLEDRMGALCGKVRIRGQPPRPNRNRGSEERGGTTFRSGMSDNDDMSDGEEMYMGRRMLPPIQSRLPDSEDESRGHGYNSPSISGSEDYRKLRQQRPGFMDTPSSASSMTQSRAIYQQRGLGAETEEESESEAPPPDQGTASQSEGGSEANDQLSELPTMFQKDKREFTPRSADQSQHTLAAGDEDEKKEDFTENVDDTERNEDQQTEGTQESSTESEESSSSEESSEEEDEVSEGEEEEKEEEGEKISEEKDEEKETQEKETLQEEEREAEDKVTGLESIEDKRGQTFITEVSATTTKSRVTIVSPRREDTRAAFLREIAEEERDLVMEYWLSEHHRFEYGEYADVMCQLDPLSYHQMGLAVPGSFLPRPDKKYEALPWREPSKGGTDIMDIHKMDLDRLAHRLHRMYDKVYKASMLSVRPTRKSNDRREHSLLQSSMASKETTSVSASTVLAPKASTVESQDLTRSHTLDSIETPELPKLENRRLGTSKSGRLVYYPKPIPPPELLPLTRTTAGKAYPRMADAFANSDPTVRNPAIRIVNQRNLAKETKLTLFRERTRASQKGPNSTERKFRLMLEQEKSVVSSRKSTATKPTFSRAVTKASGDFEDELVDLKSEDSDNEGSTWSRIKPKNRNREYSGLKWERVKTLVHSNLTSERAEERVDAAKHLGLLRCGDTMVFYALKDRMKADEDKRVRYEAAKSLILIGCWEEDVQMVIIKYLAIGNTEIRLDLIRTMIDGRNVQYVNKSLSTFPELAKMLSHFCRNPDPDDQIALDAAILLGKLCVADNNAKVKLKLSLEYNTDTHVKAKSLEILVRQLNCTDSDVVRSITDMLHKSFVWKHRALAAELLIVLGPKNVLKVGEVDKLYEILERRLWDEPIKEVRVAAAKALTALGLFGKACEKIEKRLENPEEDVRAQAVIAVGTLGMKNEKTTRMLLEMFELDASDYVRLMIVRTFVVLKSTDKRVLRALKEKEKIDGPLAREAKKALKTLEVLRELGTPLGRRTMTPNHKAVTPAISNVIRPLTQSI